MDLLAPVKALDRYQRRHAWLGFPIAVVKKFADDQAGNLSALIAYYGFFSLFPLLLVFVTILGFVLQGDPSAQKSIEDSVLKQFPVVGGQLRVGQLHGSGVALAIGLVGAVLSGLGVTLASQTAFNRVYAVPHRERPNPVTARLRGLGILVVVGVLQVVSTAVNGLVTGGFGGVGTTIAGIVVSIALNLLLFFAAFRLLTDDAVPTRELWPGIATAAVLWTVLQSAGGAYIGHVVKGAGQTYGTFATVIGLLTWLFLGARVVVLSAEVNSVLSRRLWPRGLFDPPTDADREQLRALAQIEERRQDQQVDVDFQREGDSQAGEGDGQAGADQPAAGADPARGGARHR